MAALNKTQLEHAKTRVAAAMAAFIHRSMAALGEEPDVCEFSGEEKLAMIRSGEAKLRAKINANHCYGELLDFFEYTDTQQMAEARIKLATWEVARDAIKDKANATQEQLIDELVMSPDGTAALARIAAAFA